MSLIETLQEAAPTYVPPDEYLVSDGSPTETLFELAELKVETTQEIPNILASAIQTTPSALKRTLQRRKEDELLRILPKGEISEDLEDSIESLAGLL